MVISFQSLTVQLYSTTKLHLLHLKVLSLTPVLTRRYNCFRKYTVGIATPSLAGNPGDVVYNANPVKGGYVGWIYTTENDWFRFGSVSLSKTLSIGIFDKVGIATTSPGDNIS